jgi:hypothetical protein
VLDVVAKVRAVLYPTFRIECWFRDNSIATYFGVMQADYLLYCELILKDQTYLLTPWNRVLEKLTGSQLVNKFPAFYVVRKFITAFTTARHLSLS